MVTFLKYSSWKPPSSGSTEGGCLANTRLATSAGFEGLECDVSAAHPSQGPMDNFAWAKSLLPLLLLPWSRAFWNLTESISSGPHNVLTSLLPEGDLHICFPWLWTMRSCQGLSISIRSIKAHPVTHTDIGCNTGPNTLILQYLLKASDMPDRLLSRRDSAEKNRKEILDFMMPMFKRDDME